MGFKPDFTDVLAQKIKEANPDDPSSSKQVTIECAKFDHRGGSLDAEDIRQLKDAHASRLAVEHMIFHDGTTGSLERWVLGLEHAEWWPRLFETQASRFRQADFPKKQDIERLMREDDALKPPKCCGAWIPRGLHNQVRPYASENGTGKITKRLNIPLLNSRAGEKVATRM